MNGGPRRRRSSRHGERQRLASRRAGVRRQRARAAPRPAPGGSISVTSSGGSIGDRARSPRRAATPAAAPAPTAGRSRSPRRPTSASAARSTRAARTPTATPTRRAPAATPATCCCARRPARCRSAARCAPRAAPAPAARSPPRSAAPAATAGASTSSPRRSGRSSRSRPTAATAATTATTQGPGGTGGAIYGWTDAPLFDDQKVVDTDGGSGHPVGSSGVKTQESSPTGADGRPGDGAAHASRRAAPTRSSTACCAASAAHRAEVALESAQDGRPDAGLPGLRPGRRSPSSRSRRTVGWTSDAPGARELHAPALGDAGLRRRAEAERRRASLRFSLRSLRRKKYRAVLKLRADGIGSVQATLAAGPPQGPQDGDQAAREAHAERRQARRPDREADTAQGRAATARATRCSSWPPRRTARATRPRTLTLEVRK